MLPKIHVVAFVLSLSSVFISRDSGIISDFSEWYSGASSTYLGLFKKFIISKESLVDCVWSNSISVVSTSWEGSMPAEAIHFATISDTEPNNNDIRR